MIIFFYSTLIRLALKICHLEKNQAIKHVFLLLKNTSYNVLLVFFIFFIHLINFKFIHKLPCYIMNVIK
jgi:hypothetical protein